MSPSEILDGPSGSTPMQPKEIANLLTKTIASREELNAAEQANIIKAAIWLSSKKINANSLLTIETLKTLRRRMFSDVWKWAGKFRNTETNIGVDWWKIQEEFRLLCENSFVQISDMTPSRWTNDEIAIRFHHRLVSIHPFVNGNGRHARLFASHLVCCLGEAPFTWGSANLGVEGQARRRYLDSLKVADKDHAFEQLLKFARD
jgi:Fic-DOC domain mobile mystery protein B